MKSREKYLKNTTLNITLYPNLLNLKQKTCESIIGESVPHSGIFMKSIPKYWVLHYTVRIKQTEIVVMSWRTVDKGIFGVVNVSKFVKRLGLITFRKCNSVWVSNISATQLKPQISTTKRQKQTKNGTNSCFKVFCAKVLESENLNFIRNIQCELLWKRKHNMFVGINAYNKWMNK